jgi:hypothetical protein
MNALTDFESGSLVQEVKNLSKNIELLGETLQTLDANWNKEHDSLRKEVSSIKIEIGRLKGFFTGAVFICTIIGGFTGYMM